MINHRSKDPIGIFDSGVGGLTVANAIHRLLPNESLIYFGDTAHLPYGDKSPDAIRHFAIEISRTLIEKGCKAIVVACNSAATVAHKELQDYLNDKAIFVEVVKPLVQTTIDSKADRVGIIATKATIDSGEYQRRLKSKKQTIQLFPKATPLLVPMIEEGFVDDEISRTILKEYLSTNDFKNLDVLLLACTHYPLIKDAIVRHLTKTKVFDSTEVTALELSRQLSTHGLLNEQRLLANNQFFVSDYTDNFEKSARMFFGSDVNLKEWNIWKD